MVSFYGYEMCPKYPDFFESIKSLLNQMKSLNFKINSHSQSNRRSNYHFLAVLNADDTKSIPVSCNRLYMMSKYRENYEYRKSDRSQS